MNCLFVVGCSLVKEFGWLDVVVVVVVAKVVWKCSIPQVRGARCVTIASAPRMHVSPATVSDLGKDFYTDSRVNTDFKQEHI